MVVTVPLVLAVLCLSAFALHSIRRRRGLELELAELLARARVDGPTMLGNRRAFTEALDAEVSRSSRTGRPAALLAIALDSELWRGQADSCAQEALAEVIGTEVRGADTGYRLGTDEFALVLPEVRGHDGLALATRIEARFLTSGGRAGSLSIGIAELGPGIDRYELIRHARCAMRAAARGGRSCLLLYSPEFEHASSHPPLDLADFEALDGPVA